MALRNHETLAQLRNRHRNPAEKGLNAQPEVRVPASRSLFPSVSAIAYFKQTGNFPRSRRAAA